MVGVSQDNIDGYILYKLDKGKTLRDIIIEGSFNLKAYIHMNRRKITEMIKNWQLFNGIRKEVTAWHPRRKI